MTVVNDVPTVVQRPRPGAAGAGDEGSGGVNSPTTPTTANYITVTQYHVQFVRSDGRNTPGVDVPYAFDGGVTLTVGPTKWPARFTLVRNIAKERSAAHGARGQGRDHLDHRPESRSTATTRPAARSAPRRNISVDFGNFGDKDAS